MATKYGDLFQALAAPFEPWEVRTKEGPGGRRLRYITARVAMNRLDLVLGPENWCDAYQPHENSVICKLTITLPDGSTLTKSDAGGYPGMADQGDDDKGGYSDAFKRACVKFGVGRHLYRDGVADFLAGSLIAPGPLPQDTERRDAPPRSDDRDRRGSPADDRPSDDRPPTSGRALFAKLSSLEKRFELPLIRSVNAWAKERGNKDRMIDWPRDMVSDAWVFASTLVPMPAVGSREPGQDG